jgi:uncharacterized glyoxalase superfamily protein PhnB
MTDIRTVASEVEVAVDPGTAFTAFTDEMDSWWVHGPISFHDAARAIGKRCEPGVGGRVLEVYDDEGDALELARITVWEPGARLAWASSIDDVEIEVTFTPAGDDATVVRVEARTPAGGRDGGGSSWVRVVGWFADWCTRRATTPPGPRPAAPVAIAVHYAKPKAAARWLAATFGLSSPLPLPTDDDPGLTWIEFWVGNVPIIIFGLEGTLAEGQPATHEPWVFVADLDAHLARAIAAGATIVTPIHQHGYRAYTALDVEGHRWTFAQAPPLMQT